MTPEQELKYFKMVDHVNQGQFEEAREIVSDAIAQKLAGQLADVNSQKQESNQQRFWADKHLATATDSE